MKEALNRTSAPASQEIKEINFLKASTLTLKSGQNLHYIADYNQGVIKVELFFKAGTIHQPSSLVASATNALIFEGSLNYSAAEIAELFDNHGAFLETECRAEGASVILYCLTKSLATLLPLFKELVFSAIFPEEELSNYINLNKQKFLVNSEKVAFQAKNHFLSFLLGEQNAFANKVELSDFDQLNQQDIQQFYQERYKSGPLEIFVSGGFKNDTLEVLSGVFEAYKCLDIDESLNLSLTPEGDNLLYLEDEKAIQSAIRIGSVVVARDHEDFPALFVANTILGGYFGSRLMNNIREDKGYTYGIGSGIISFKGLSYFVISTEVGVEVTQATLKEIELEVNRMSTTFVSEEELGLVKNFILGSIMRNFDGAFVAMDRFKMLQTQGLDYSYYDHLVRRIQSISSDEISRVSREYLDFDSMKKIIVGKK